VSVWLDDISRDRLRTGNLQELADGYHVVGVTSNPTIFAHAVDHGDAYDGQLADLKTRGAPTPGWRTSCSSGGSPGHAGRRCGLAGRRSSGRCGPRRPRRTRRSPTPCT